MAHPPPTSAHRLTAQKKKHSSTSSAVHAKEQRDIISSLYANLDKYFQRTKTALSLRMAPKSGIRHWIFRLQNSSQDTTPFPEWHPNPYNTGASTPAHIQSISLAYKSQCNIGWDNLIRGRISNLWGTAYLHSRSLVATAPANLKWSTNLIKIIWKSALHLWAQRCTTLGEVELELEHQQATSQREQTEFRIQRLFLHGKFKTLPEDHHYLFTQHTLPTLLDQPYQTLLLWLETYTSANNKWQKHTDGRINNPIDRGPTQTTLHRYFQQRQPLANPPA